MASGKKSKAPEEQLAPRIISPAKPPDRLVAFIWLLDQMITNKNIWDVSVQDLVDQATEINLSEVPTIPELREGEAIPESYEEAMRFHTWALTISGSTAKVRAAVSQLGVSDGQTAGSFDPSQIQPDRIGDLVKEVADRMAREVADKEAQS